MRRTQLSVVIVFVLFVMAPPAAQATAPRSSAEVGTARHLDTIRTSPAKLRAFLKAMPKGADLHNHLSGAVPTETLIGFAVEDGLASRRRHSRRCRRWRVGRVPLVSVPPPTRGQTRRSLPRS